ncbi:tumor necrosis factor receptor superfamily member 13B isoform X1 [Takifugu flavidus]|nr:tumor necrosis factor receptor superfamily member 13B isoform X1 [Takifugu flavidus]XP_056882159.1 tumor necrosis factor receptor superfamily member 13B isoform X1 [Takifugu flavidus]
MASECRSGQYWDILIKRCMHCDTECKREPIMSRCKIYCQSAQCKAQPGHYYDGLLRKCLMCTEICGRHPAECWEHCRTDVITTTITSPVLESRVVTRLEEPTLLLYPLLAVSLVLLVSSLSLALVVFLKGSRNSRSKECAVPLCQEVSQPVNSDHPTSYDQSDDSSPTETCVCVHCFPDLKALSHGHDMSLRAPFSLYPVFQRAQVKNGGPLQTEVNIPTSEAVLQQASVVG